MTLLALLLAQWLGPEAPPIQPPFHLPPYQCTGTGCVSRSIPGKLGDWISIKDFGGVCDGVTDDSTAMNSGITAAATAGATKTVVIWSNCIGTYTQPVNGVRVLDFRRGSGSGAI